ncbi:hypothetical protein A5652_19610 [Mycobacterium sp. 1165178.9]|nr:hypothetical protein A5652_19610 [Mycobacterium sp. 1165178.9]
MQTDPAATPEIGAGARWSIMISSLLATASSFLFINGVAFLIPSLQAVRGIRLDEAGLLASMPSWGMVVTLVLWGYVLDRVGERVVMTTGSALTAAAAYAAASAHSIVMIALYLFLGGMAAAACNTAGGRLVSAWFPPHQHERHGHRLRHHQQTRHRVNSPQCQRPSVWAGEFLNARAGAGLAWRVC